MEPPGALDAVTTQQAPRGHETTLVLAAPRGLTLLVVAASLPWSVGLCGPIERQPRAPCRWAFAVGSRVRRGHGGGRERHCAGACWTHPRTPAPSADRSVRTGQALAMGRGWGCDLEQQDPGWPRQCHGLCRALIPQRAAPCQPVGSCRPHTGAQAPPGLRAHAARVSH